MHFQTLRNWDREGKIKTIRSPGGKRFYDVKSFLEETDKKEKIENEKMKKVKEKNMLLSCKFLFSKRRINTSSRLYENKISRT